MRVLIVGARGMLGSDLMRSLGTAHQVVGADIEDFDITDQEATVSALRAIRPQWVVNVAAYTQVDRCEEEVGRAFQVNAEGVKHLAMASRQIGATLLQMSTDYVFDGKTQQPYGEEDPPSPLSVYGRSKLKGESYVQDLLEDYVIVRSGGLYGRGGVNFVNTIIKTAREKSKLGVVNDQWVAPTYTVDLSGAIGALLTLSPKGIFHVVNGGRCTWYQCACKILELVESKSRVVPISTQELNRPAPRPAFSVLNGERFTTLTGVQLRSWEEALTEYLSLPKGV